MKRRILILSTYPAPYRSELFVKIKEKFKTDIFFESSRGDFRENEWFSKGDFCLLDTKEGLQAFKHAVKCINSYDIVAFYEFSTKTAIKLITKCIIKHIPYVINCDGVMMSPHGNPVFDTIKRFLISNASACLASGKNAKNYFLRYGAKESRIHKHTFSTLHNGDVLSAPIEAKEKSELRKKLGLPEDKFISIAVGRFIPLKRYDYLIKEWRNMPENNILLLVGSGSEEEKYREIIKSYNINNVIIEKFHPKEELFEFYKASDVFVHPTSYDVWGLVLNEAFACGLPAVVSDHCVGGLELIIDSENGYLVPMGDDKLMCERVSALEKNKVLFDNMSKNALKTIKNYTIENMAKTHISVFEELTGSDNN